MPLESMLKHCCCCKKVFNFGISGGRLTATPICNNRQGPFSMMYCFTALAYAYSTSTAPQPSMFTPAEIICPGVSVFWYVYCSM
jgi:hypothetical protein